jgi:hypothetical protein
MFATQGADNYAVDTVRIAMSKTDRPGTVATPGLTILEPSPTAPGGVQAINREVDGW